MTTLTEILRDIFIVIGAMTALLILLIAIIAKMPADSPLKRLLKALTYRVGATIAAGVFAIPLEPVPVLDVLYDIGAPLLLLLYWVSFFKNAGRTVSDPYSRRADRAPLTIDHSPPQHRPDARNILRRLARP